MNKALKKAMSIGVVLTLMLVLVLGSAVSVFAAYKDGTYSISFSGGVGGHGGGVRGVTAIVSGGKITTLALTMSSANYDYCYDPVTGGRVNATTGGGNSVFS